MLDRITPPEVRPFGHLSLPPMKRIVLDNGIILNVYDHSFQDVQRRLMRLTQEEGWWKDGVACHASMLVPVMLDGSRMYPAVLFLMMSFDF